MHRVMDGVRRGATITMHGTRHGIGTAGIGTGVRHGLGLGAGVPLGLGAGVRHGDPAGARHGAGVRHGDPAGARHGAGVPVGDPDGVVRLGDRRGRIVQVLLPVAVLWAFATDIPA